MLKKALSFSRIIKCAVLLVVTVFSAPLHAIVITDGDFSSWTLGSSGAASVVRESSDGNPGARLKFTNSPVQNTVYGTALKSDFSITSPIEGYSFDLQLDVLSGFGGFGQGQRISLIVEQNSSLYSFDLGITGWPLNWDTLIFSGTMTGSSFLLLSGLGPATADFTSGTETSFGFQASNSSGGSYTLAQYYDNFSLELSSPSAVPVPAAVWLFGTALIGFVGMSRRRKVA